jgi:hypothetical protein
MPIGKQSKTCRQLTCGPRQLCFPIGNTPVFG